MLTSPPGPLPNGGEVNDLAPDGGRGRSGGPEPLILADCIPDALDELEANQAATLAVGAYERAMGEREGART